MKREGSIEREGRGGGCARSGAGNRERPGEEAGAVWRMRMRMWMRMRVALAETNSARGCTERQEGSGEGKTEQGKELP